MMNVIAVFNRSMMVFPYRAVQAATLALKVFAAEVVIDAHEALMRCRNDFWVVTR
jgi:hypothetical protein